MKEVRPRVRLFHGRFSRAAAPNYAGAAKKR
jgi:hypothetical protein